MPALALVTALALWAGPPAPRPPQGPPPRWLDGLGGMAFGGTLQLLSAGAGVGGIALGGSRGMTITWLTVSPAAIGGSLVMTGAWMRGRYQVWYDPRDLLRRARVSRRVGGSLMGVGLGLFVGNAVGMLVWPMEPVYYDEGRGARYPWGLAAVESGFLLGQLMIGAGGSALSWSAGYSNERSRRIELTPTLGGLSMQF